MLSEICMTLKRLAAIVPGASCRWAMPGAVFECGKGCGCGAKEPSLIRNCKNEPPITYGHPIISGGQIWQPLESAS